MSNRKVSAVNMPRVRCSDTFYVEGEIILIHRNTGYATNRSLDLGCHCQLLAEPGVISDVRKA